MGLINPQDLLILKQVLWPDVMFYEKQLEVIDSVFSTPETYVPAGNDLGKDFVAGFIALGAFVICQARGIGCRIVTTSVAEHHLKVLWGEIGRFATGAKQSLIGPNPGQLILNYQELRRSEEAEAKNPYNYLVGRVTSQGGEGMAGHHAPFTLCIGDEASGLSDTVYSMAQGWASHMLWIGNPNACSNFFRRGCDAGDLLA